MLQIVYGQGGGLVDIVEDTTSLQDLPHHPAVVNAADRSLITLVKTGAFDDGPDNGETEIATTTRFYALRSEQGLHEIASPSQSFRQRTQVWQTLHKCGL